MKEAFYKGKAYKFKQVETGYFQLLDDDGKVVKVVAENELDIKTIVSLIIDQYYRNIKSRA